MTYQLKITLIRPTSVVLYGDDKTCVGRVSNQPKVVFNAFLYRPYGYHPVWVRDTAWDTAKFICKQD